MTDDINPHNLEEQPDKGITKEELNNSSLNKMEYNKMGKLPYNDVEDVVIFACKVINDIDSKAKLVGYLDDIPALMAAVTGSENIIPQFDDLDDTKKAAIAATIKNELNLSEGAEQIAVCAFVLIADAEQLRLAIQAAKPAK